MIERVRYQLIVILLGNVTVQAYTDNDIPDGTYYYVVIAENATGTSGISNCVSITIQSQSNRFQDNLYWILPSLTGMIGSISLAIYRLSYKVRYRKLLKYADETDPLTFDMIAEKFHIKVNNVRKIMQKSYKDLYDRIQDGKDRAEKLIQKTTPIKKSDSDLTSSLYKTRKISSKKKRIEVIRQNTNTQKFKCIYI